LKGNITMGDARLPILALLAAIGLTNCQTRMPTSELKVAMTPLGTSFEPLQGTYRNIPVNKTGRDHTVSDLWLLVGGDINDLKHGSDTVSIDPVSHHRLKFTLRHHGIPARSFTRRLAQHHDWVDLGCRPTGETAIVMSMTGKECAAMGMTAAGRLCIAKQWQGVAWWFWMPVAVDHGGSTVFAYYQRDSDRRQ
jgi:hypothetical protein